MQITQFVLPATQHVLYVLIMLSPLVRDATVVGGWLEPNVLNAMIHVLLVQVSLLMNVMVLAQGFS
jgi:hypothetical protein